MSGDHNEHQKEKSYLDQKPRMKRLQWHAKPDGDDLLVCFDYAEKPDEYVRFVRAEQQSNFECPRCGHCCQAKGEDQEPLYWNAVEGWVYADDTSQGRVDEIVKDEQEPVAWMHNFIEGNVITHIPADIGRHPERWTALYKDPTPCKTCESLAMTVMNDQTYHEKVIPKREWVGLTDAEINSVRYKRDWTAPWTDTTFARAIEAKLREKNT